MARPTKRELDLGYCEEAQTYCSVAEERYKQGRVDMKKTIDEELKEVRHCLELAKEQMLIDYVYIACEHLDNIEKLKEKNNG